MYESRVELWHFICSGLMQLPAEALLTLHHTYLMRRNASNLLMSSTFSYFSIFRNLWGQRIFISWKNSTSACDGGECFAVEQWHCHLRPLLLLPPQFGSEILEQKSSVRCGSLSCCRLHTMSLTLLVLLVLVISTCQFIERLHCQCIAPVSTGDFKPRTRIGTQQNRQRNKYIDQNRTLNGSKMRVGFGFARAFVIS